MFAQKEAGLSFSIPLVAERLLTLELQRLCFFKKAALHTQVLRWASYLVASFLLMSWYCRQMQGLLNPNRVNTSPVVLQCPAATGEQRGNDVWTRVCVCATVQGNSLGVDLVDTAILQLLVKTHASKKENTNSSY